MIRADHISIDTDEGRFTLAVSTDAGTMLFDIHGIALDVYDEVVSRLRPWHLEAEHARATRPRKITTQVEDVYDHVDAGYALDDPKHPRYHSTHADTWDAREGK